MPQRAALSFGSCSVLLLQQALAVGNFPLPILRQVAQLRGRR